MARLEIVEGGHTGKCFDFKDEVRLGRSPDNDFCLPDVRVSRYHARITRNGPHFILEDLNSLNGTSRRGTRLIPATPCLLASGDELEIGSVRLVFYDISSNESPQDQTPETDDNEQHPNQTIKLDIEAMASLSLRWIDDDITSASIVVTRDATPALSPVPASPDVPPADCRQTYRRLQAMCNISMKIGMITDLDALLPKILDCLFDIYPGAERAAMLLCTASDAAPVPVATKTRNGCSRPHELALSRTIVNDVLHHQHAILSKDMLSDDRFKHRESVITHAIRSMMCTPLLTDNQTLGLIQLDTGRRSVQFTEDDLEVLIAISAQVAMAVKTAQLLAQLQAANVALQREMAERQQADALWSQARAQALEAQAANAAKSQFLAIISHEIRTPLNGVFGITELLSNTPLNAEQKEYVNTIHQCSNALLTLINDILDCSRIEAGKLTLETIAFELRAVIEEVYAIVSVKAHKKGLNLTHRTQANVPQVVQGDPNRLRQILLNLVSNAVKFTDRGDIAIDLSQIAWTPDSVYLRFTVSDTGIGIAPEAQDRLFQAFEQADASITRQYGGSGLGLAISRQLTKLMGGDIGFDSIPGQGSVFWFTVRLKHDTIPEEADAMSAMPTQHTQALCVPSPCQGQKHILLVEDSPVNQKVAMLMMEKFGYTVDVVDNGHDAIRAVKLGTYDLIFMDCQMPEMDGLTASAAIRQHEAKTGGRTPIIAMTANAMQEDRDRCFAAGMDDFVSKPVHSHKLLELIEKWT